MTRDEAMNEFRALVNRYGVQWNASVPAAIYDRLNKINTVLTEKGSPGQPSACRTANT